MTTKTVLTLAVVLSAVSLSAAQTRVTTTALRKDQTALVRTAQGITTKISFPDIVKEIICGDLYDPATGHGAFVVQRSGQDIFLKPVTASGVSNLFVRVGQVTERMYSFDLTIVSASQACRVFNIINAQDNASTRSYQSPETAKIIADAEQQAAEIARAADQRIAAILSEVPHRAALTEFGLIEHADSAINQRFGRALVAGMREIKIDAVHARKDIVVALDPYAVALDGKLYLRYQIQNLGNSVFVFQSLKVEAGLGTNKRSINVEIVQSKGENVLESREALAGIILIEQKAINIRDGLTLLVRGKENDQIARLTVSEE